MPCHRSALKRDIFLLVLSTLLLLLYTSLPFWYYFAIIWGIPHYFARQTAYGCMFGGFLFSVAILIYIFLLPTSAFFSPPCTSDNEDVDDGAQPSAGGREGSVRKGTLRQLTRYWTISALAFVATTWAVLYLEIVWQLAVDGLQWDLVRWDLHLMNMGVGKVCAAIGLFLLYLLLLLALPVVMGIVAVPGVRLGVIGVKARVVGVAWVCERVGRDDGLRLVDD